MKRYVLAALAALSLAAPAFALEELPASTMPRNRRVAVVEDDSRFGVGVATQNQNANNIAKALGGLYETLERQGCQVDYFNSSWFLKSTNMTNSEATLWKNLGDTYALVFVHAAVALGTKAAGATNTTRFYRADSTNAQLFLVYGNRSKELSGGDSTFSHVVAATSTVNWVSSSGEAATGSRIAYRPYGSTDTLFLPLHGTPPMAGNVASGISGVVRWLEPLRIGGTLNPLTNADSTLVSFPAAGDSTASSTGGTYELLGPGWRTLYSNGRWVENVCSQYASPLYTRNVAPIAYAVAARYLDVQPIKIACEWDDVYDMNASGKRFSNAGMDSLMATFAAFGCKPAISTNPLHAYEYIRGDNPTWEPDAWSGAAWTWPRKWGVSWVHHSHDSSAVRPTSNLVGRFGGYTSGNGLSTNIGGRQVYAFHRARGFAWAPGQTEHEGRYGIYQKLLYSDSLRRIVCPECVVPPYLSFPDNEVLPVNWRDRGVASDVYPYRSRYHGYVTASLTALDSLCTVDSTFLAMARGLRIPNGGTLYIRGTVCDGPGAVPTLYNMRPWGGLSPLNAYSGREGKLYAADSVIAWTPFLYPGETRTVRDRLGVTDPAGGGRPYTVYVKNIAAVQFDGTSINVESARSLSMRALSRITGLWSGVLDGGATGVTDGTNDWLANAYAKDPTGVFGSGTEQPGWQRDRPRIIYMHPSNYTGSTGIVPTGPGQNSNTANFVAHILRPIRALNTLAGKTIIQWTDPWKVYDK